MLAQNGQCIVQIYIVKTVLLLETLFILFTFHFIKNGAYH